MRTEFEITLRGRTSPTPLVLEERAGGLWFLEADSVSCVATDPRSAIMGALGLAQGQEVWQQELARRERGNYFDQYERRDILDPRDLVPSVQPDKSHVVVFDPDGFKQILGE